MRSCILQAAVSYAHTHADASRQAGLFRFDLASSLASHTRRVRGYAYVLYLVAFLLCSFRSGDPAQAQPDCRVSGLSFVLAVNSFHLV